MIEILIPESIKIGGFDYIVRHGGMVDEELKARGLYGYHNSHQRYIDLRDDANPQQFSSIFIHEILHAIEEIYLGEELTEQHIHGFTQGLLQILEQLEIRFVKEA